MIFNRFPCDKRVCQAASGVTSSYDALLELFECLASFLKRLEIYTTIPPTPILTEVVVKLMVELLSVLALASKQIKQGRFSKCALTYTLLVAQCFTMFHREVREKVAGGKGNRNCSPKIGSINPGRGWDNCCSHLGCRPWSCGKCKGGHGRCLKVTRLFSKLFLSTVRLDGKASTDGIRQDLGLCLAQNR
jgi:hypothetical protein